MFAYLLNSLPAFPPMLATAIVSVGLTYGGVQWRVYRRQLRRAQQQQRLRWPLAGMGRLPDDAWRAGVRSLLAQAEMRAEYTTDRWGARHYRLAPRQTGDTSPALQSVMMMMIARPAADEAPAREQEDEGDHQLWPIPQPAPTPAAAN